MISRFIAILIGVIVFILGILSEDTCIKGGSGKNILTIRDYSKHLHIKPFDKKFATGDLVKDYPECAFMDNTTEIAPAELTYDGAVPTRDVPQRHWGQRKLLLTEIDFLNLIPQKECIVVYAGAADGRHLTVLTELYPYITWHLYDPRAFYPGLDHSPLIQINPYYGGKVNRARNDKRTEADLRDQFGWFTDEVAEWYKGKNVYFVSDIRTVPTDEEVERNQRQQERWIKIMRPVKSMLKFRVAYAYVGKPRKYKYMGGKVRLQCWAPIHSAETRLIVDGVAPSATWDVVTYERNMAWYNQIMRAHDFSDEPLRDHGIPVDGTVRDFWEKYVKVPHYGFDFVYELQILRDCITARDKALSLDELNKTVAEINNVILSKHDKFLYHLKK